MEADHCGLAVGLARQAPGFLDEQEATDGGAINAHLAKKGMLLREGTIVDATLIAAPPSTKNREGKRDEEMHQTKKGQQWYFGMKAHIGVDAQSGLVHTLIGTAANVSDVTQARFCMATKRRPSAMPATRAWKSVTKILSAR